MSGRNYHTCKYEFKSLLRVIGVEEGQVPVTTESQEVVATEVLVMREMARHE